ncbi:MAG: DNA/RNA nuclease SfsA [Spirochaetaceae bacterium]|nr:DNA/RNA nuclease SfsA [Spirochaetaceae bacterium]
MRVTLFSNDREAFFAGRPNRFLIMARSGGDLIPCHCPNPGRMEELLFPGTRLILERRQGAGIQDGGKAIQAAGGKAAKTAWTAAALYHLPLGGDSSSSGNSGDETIVPLISARANLAAEKLILPRIIPALKETRPEFTLGNSRFDFLCTGRGNTKHLVEVKACSLVEYETAMFPDAPSERALKHLEKLAALKSQGYVCHIVFVIVHGRVEVFTPNLHTDPAFAAALYRHKKDLSLHAALIQCNRDGEAVLLKEKIPVVFHGKLAEENRGSYLVMLHLKRKTAITAGSLGKLSLKPGWYVYSGSALQNLRQRLSRHLRKTNKTKHWHIDYLVPRGTGLKGFPIASRRSLECDLAAELKKAGGRGIPGFGASDCRNSCGSHLFYFENPPLENREFTGMLLRFRHREAFIP